MNTTQTIVSAPLKLDEPVLPRKPLLKVLEDRMTLLGTYQYKPNTFVLISSWYNNKQYQGFGFSKVCYPDAWEMETGIDIAVKKALISIYHQILKESKPS